MNSYLWNLWFFPGFFWVNGGQWTSSNYQELTRGCGILHPNINCCTGASFSQSTAHLWMFLSKQFPSEMSKSSRSLWKSVQNDLLPRNNWNPGDSPFVSSKKQTSRWPKRLCGVVSHEVQDGEHRHECLKRYVRIKGPPKTVGYTKWKHARSPAEIEQKMTKEWSHQGLQVTETNRHSLASTHGAIMNSMNPICEKAWVAMCKVRNGKCHKCPSVAILYENPWNSAESMGKTMALWGKIRFPTLVPGFLWSPHFPLLTHLLTLSRSFNMPTGSPAPSPYHPERRIHRHLGESWVKSYDFAYDWDEHPLIIDDLVPSYPSLDYFTSNYCLYHHLPIILMWIPDDLEVQTMCTFTLRWDWNAVTKPMINQQNPTNVKVHQPNH